MYAYTYVLSYYSTANIFSVIGRPGHNPAGDCLDVESSFTKKVHRFAKNFTITVFA